MDKGQFAILRFAKYKGPEIANIEAHNERTKEKYASNPDVDTNRSKNNFHIIQPTDKYRAMSEAQLKADLYNLQRQMEKIPPEIVAMYTGKRLSRERGD